MYPSWFNPSWPLSTTQPLAQAPYPVMGWGGEWEKGKARGLRQRQFISKAKEEMLRTIITTIIITITVVVIIITTTKQVMHQCNGSPPDDRYPSHP